MRKSFLLVFLLQLLLIGTLFSKNHTPETLTAGYHWKDFYHPECYHYPAPSISDPFFISYKGLTRFGEKETTAENKLYYNIKKQCSAGIAKNTVTNTFNAKSSYAIRLMKVNLFGGTNAYNQGGWNNWNATGSTNITSGNFAYSDGTASAVSAVMSISQAISDNGTDYGGTMCPPEVLRYTTYSSSNRTLTLQGLNNNLRYDLELYASRASTGNTTIFTIHDVSKQVASDHNKTNKVVFTDLAPTNGQIVIDLSKTGSFNYLNGFILTEKAVLDNSNIKPVANAGADTTITYPEKSVQLDGSQSTYLLGSMVLYRWSKVAGPSSFTINNSTSSTTLVTNLVSGTYSFELSVTDTFGAISKDTVNVIVKAEVVLAATTGTRNAPPQISGTTSYTTFSGSVTLNLTAKDDNVSPTRWHISKLKAPGQLKKSIAVIGSSTAKGYGVGTDSQFVNVVKAYYKSTGVVDTIYNLAQTSTRIWEGMPTGYIAPTPYTGGSYPSPNPLINLTAAKNKPGVSLILVNYPSNGYNLDSIPQVMQAMQSMKDSAASWKIPIFFTTTQARDGFSPTEEIKLGRMKDSIIKRFPNNYINFYNGFIEPGTTAMRQDFKQADNVHYNGLGHLQFGKQVIARNPISTTVLSGSRILNPSTSNTVIDKLSVGTHYFCAAVQDSDSLWNYTTITVNAYAGPQLPTANAGSDQVVNLPKNSTQLDGTASFDADGSIISYEWTKIAGPGTYSIDNKFSSKPFLTNLVRGNYVFNLRVTDNDRKVSYDTITVIVNYPPLAQAGKDIVLTLPINSTRLTGSTSTDQDGIIAGYSWQKVSGPGQFTLSGTAVADPTLTNLTAGNYVFELTVKDNNNALDKDSVTIVVRKGFNVAPVANAGPDQRISLPANSTSIDGSASTDPDGIIVTYLWKQIQGPGVATISNTRAAQTIVSNLAAGRYLFELRVTDDSTAIGKDTVVITVDPNLIYTTRRLNVNLFGGTNAYNQGGWNNWNVTGTSNITSGSFAYSDGAVSLISAVLSNSQGVSDNGATYGGTMCPPEVLRYATYYSSDRTLTLRGLNNNLRYDLELYSSRANTGNTTIYIINGVSKQVTSDHNKTNKVVFTALAPSSGQIVINLSKTGIYNYLNGFVLTEAGSVTQATVLSSTASQTSTIHVQDRPIRKATLLFSPNPFHSHLQMTFTSPVPGEGIVSIFNATGRMTKQIKLNLRTDDNISLPVKDLPDGVYFISVTVNGISYTQRVVRMQR